MNQEVRGDGECLPRAVLHPRANAHTYTPLPTDTGKLDSRRRAISLFA